MTTWPLQRDCPAFYGNPGVGGKPSSVWESANLVLAPCPWTLRYDGKVVSGLRVHRKCADSLRRVLAAIWGRCGRSQAEIDRIGMSVYGGGYNFRAMRTGTALSMHSYGCATDFDPARNGLGDRTPAMDRRVIEEFEREGWEWGGHWSNPDGMHFQAAWTSATPKRLAVVVAPIPAKLPVLRKGATGDDVATLQGLLNVAGAGLRVDSDFGGLTETAVLTYQRCHALTADGVVGRDTWTALLAA